jgi:(R)-amidase
MKSPAIRLFQASCRDGDTAFNLDKALSAIAASAGHTDLLVFPETFIHGFPTPDNVAQLAEAVDGPSIAAIQAAARQANVSVAIGFAEAEHGRFFNSALLINTNGEVLLHYRKSHLYLSDQGVFERGGEFPVCEWNGLQLGLLICFDIEFPEAARALARNGAELLVVLDGNMQPYGHVHRQMLPVRAMENQLAIVMCNRVGASEHYTFCGESHVADPFGRSLLVAGSEEEIIDVTLNLSQVRAARQEYHYLELALPSR